MKRVFSTVGFFALIFALLVSFNDAAAQRHQLKWANVMAPGTPNMIAGWDSNGDPAEVDVSSGEVGVTSVFGRTGIVTAQSNDYTFAQIGSKPTTLSGYGITDPIVLTTGSYANPSWITFLAWGKITTTPTTLSGYGITDPVVLTSGSYANPSWITSLGWSKVTSTPTTFAGYGISDIASGTYTPTATSISNVDAITITDFYFIRVGNEVHVSGWMQIDATLAAGTSTTVNLTVPIASNFTTAYQASGNGVTGASDVNLTIISDPTADKVTIIYGADVTNNQDVQITFMYRILP